MPGILDDIMSYLPQGVLSGNAGPNYAALNPDAGDTDALAKAIAGSPYDPYDKKKKEEAAKEAAKGVFGTGVNPPTEVGISGQQAMNVGPFGSLAPVMPSPPVAPALPPAVADSNASSVPVPQPRPAAAPAPAPAAPLDITPSVASANAATPAVPPSAVPESSLMGRLGQGFKDVRDGIADHRSTLLAAAGGLAGAPSWGTGLSRGFTQAAAALPVDQKMVNQNQTVQALIKRGMPEDMARAAAGNPAILQQILPQAFGAKQRKFTQIGEDMMGNKNFGFVDEAAGKTYDMAGKEIQPGQAGGGVTVPSGPDGQPLQGPDLMHHLEKTSPQVAAEVKAMIAGDASTTPRNVQKLAPLAHLVDPSFDEKTYPTRLALRKSYMGGGKDFQETQALNTVGGHLGKLMDSAQGLNNSNVPIFNKAQNWFADTFTGSPALVKFRNDLVTTSNELAKAYHGGHVSDSSYAAFNKAVNEAQTPAEMKAAIGELGGLLQSKIEAKESGYRAGMANQPVPEEYRAINDEARHSFQRINDWASGRAQASGAGPAKVSSKSDYEALPKGTQYTAPDGSTRVKQ